MTYTVAQYRALEAATTSSDEMRWSDIGLPAGDMRSLLDRGLLMIAEGTAFDPLRSGTVYRLTAAGVAALRAQMRATTEGCAHRDTSLGVCLWCSALVPPAKSGVENFSFDF